ncbi:hypothetical protein [Nocardioides humilatus]|nr:hypothetical protein [Nocardioides humilatus]
MIASSVHVVGPPAPISPIAAVSEPTSAAAVGRGFSAGPAA